MNSSGSPPVRVLCVDDNTEVAAAIRIALGRAGLNCVGTLASANDLIEQVGSTQPQVVLLDVDMSGRDSFEALEEVSRVHPGVKTIMLSGHVRRELIDRALECGAWGYLSKNDGIEAVLAGIGRCLNGELAMSDEAVSALGW